MAAIAKATEILEGGVKVFAQTKAVTRRSKNAGDDDAQDADQERRDQLAGYLQTMSHKYNSFSLSQLAMSANADPFGKVKGMIESMIEKLLEDANKEATQKAFCDTETSKTRKSMADKTMTLDTLSARVDEASTKRAELEQSIKDLTGEVAELDKAMAEATAIRTQEHEEYAKSSKDFKDSADAVVAAISVLKSYYAGEGGALVQVKAKSQSLKSKQPSFGGNQGDTANTIIEVLEMSEEDFTRLLAESESDEQNSAAQYKTLAQDPRVSKASKQTEIEGKESEVKSLTVDVNNHNEDKDATGKELSAVQDYMDKLKPQCEEKAMSYEEKKARRENEIEGLKEALSIIAGDSVPAASLVQKKGFLRRVQRV
jgi:chromosome segregation ATPase